MLEIPLHSKFYSSDRYANGQSIGGRLAIPFWTLLVAPPSPPIPHFLASMCMHHCQKLRASALAYVNVETTHQSEYLSTSVCAIPYFSNRFAHNKMMAIELQKIRDEI